MSEVSGHGRREKQDTSTGGPGNQQNSQQNSQLPQLKVATILWAAILASQGAYVFLAFDAAKSAGVSRSSEDPSAGNLSLILSLVAVGLTLLSWFLPKFIAKQALMNRHRTGGLWAGLSVEQVGSRAALAELASIFSGPFVLRLALLEGVAIVGFVLAFMTRVPQMGFPYFAVAAALVAYNFPSEKNVRSYFS